MSTSAKTAIRKALVYSGIDPRRVVRLWRPIWSRYVEYTAPCVFVHVPKCAGTSVAHAAGMHGITHSTAAVWRDRLGRRRFERRFRFTIVRHPIDRLVSQLLWLSILRRDYSVRYDVATDIENETDINDYLESTIDDLLADDVTFHQDYMMVSRVLIDGENPMDYVGRFEDLNKSLNEISNYIKIDKKNMPHLKKIGDSTKNKVSLSQAMFDRLAERLEDDFRHFGYDPSVTKVQISPRWT